MIARGNRTGEAKVGGFMISLFVLDFAHAIQLTIGFGLAFIARLLCWTHMRGRGTKQSKAIYDCKRLRCDFLDVGAG